MKEETTQKKNPGASVPMRLSPEQIVELSIRMEAGDSAAREQLITAHLPLVRFFVLQYTHNATCASYEDLYQEACAGLIEAVDRYDYRRGELLSTYASYFIVKYIHKGILSECAIRLPVYLHAPLRILNKTLAEYHKKHGHPPKDEELPALTGLPQKQIDLVKNYSLTYRKTHAYTGNDDAIPQPDSRNTEYYNLEDAVLSDLGELDFSSLEVDLTKREEEVLRRKLGMYPPHKKQSFEEIGYALGLCGETARLTYLSAIKKIRLAAKRKGYTINTLPLK